jgi:hypothetical protein
MKALLLESFRSQVVYKGSFGQTKGAPEWPASPKR